MKWHLPVVWLYELNADLSLHQIIIDSDIGDIFPSIESAPNLNL